MILLVHGAWHGAWCWTPTIAALESRGVAVVAVDLPGHGAKRHLAPNVNLDDYTSAVIEAASSLPTPPLLVGHSMGGMVITAAAEREPTTFKSLVYLAAFVPANGQSLGELVGGEGPPLGRIENGEIHLDSEEARGRLYGECKPEVANWALDRIQPQPLRPVTDTVTLTDARFGSLRKDYLVCANDKAISPEFQREMAQGARVNSVVSLSSDHSAFLSHPDLLAKLLIERLD